MLSKNSSQRKIDVTSEISFICESMCVSILISAKGKTKSKTKQKNDPWFMLLYLNISFSLAPLLCLHYLLGADCLSAVFFTVYTFSFFERLDSWHAYRLLTRIFFFSFFLTLCSLSTQSALTGQFSFRPMIFTWALTIFDADYCCITEIMNWH